MCSDLIVETKVVGIDAHTSTLTMQVGEKQLDVQWNRETMHPESSNSAESSYIRKTVLLLLPSSVLVVPCRPSRLQMSRPPTDPCLFVSVCDLQVRQFRYRFPQPESHDMMTINIRFGRMNH